jgi:hypothetical protein
MADLSDVTAYLKAQALAAVYPNGVGSKNSIAGIDIRLYEGWPLPDQLEMDVAGNTKDAATGVISPRANGPLANVSIFPWGSTGGNTYQILDETYTIVAPAITTTVAVAGEIITLTGTLSPNEFLTVIIDDSAIVSQTGANVAAMLAALAAQAVTAGFAATSTATTLTIPFTRSMVVRQGGKGVVGKVTHRQVQSVMVTVWAPTPQIRTQLAAAIDNVIKQTTKTSMPDTSQAIIRYHGTCVNDDQQAVTIYRRDLIYSVEYATVEQFDAFVITSTQVSMVDSNKNAIITGIG